jgi:hypothetical protein
MLSDAFKSHDFRLMELPLLLHYYLAAWQRGVQGGWSLAF